MLTKEEALAQLRELIKPGDTVYTVLRHVSSSGMFRRISLVIVAKDEYNKGRPVIREIDYLCHAIGLAKRDERKEGLRVSGCGMDMGWELTYRLGLALWPTGTRKPHGTRNGEPDSNGGYALKHRWL